MVTNPSPAPAPPPPRLVVLAVHHRTVAFLEVLRHLCQLRLAVFVAPKTPAGPFLDRILGGGYRREGTKLRKFREALSFSFHGVLPCFTLFHYVLLCSPDLQIGPIIVVGEPSTTGGRPPIQWEIQ